MRNSSTCNSLWHQHWASEDQLLRYVRLMGAFLSGLTDKFLNMQIQRHTWSPTVSPCFQSALGGSLEAPKRSISLHHPLPPHPHPLLPPALARSCSMGSSIMDSSRMGTERRLWVGQRRVGKQSDESNFPAPESFLKLAPSAFERI